MSKYVFLYANPVDLGITMLVGFLLTVGVQAGLGFLYTKLGRDRLVKEDRWTGLYFGITGFAWVLSSCIGVFVGLLYMGFRVPRECIQMGVMIALLPGLMLLRNRFKWSQQQSTTVMLLNIAGVSVGAYLGIHAFIATHPL